MVWLLRCFVLNFVLALSLGLAPAARAATPFTKEKIQLAEHTLEVEVARTPDQHERGLMFREKLGKDDGMLFIFQMPEPLGFWMKNTLIDLSIGYFDKDQKLIDIQEMKSGKNIADAALPVYRSSGSAKYALEMNKGWFEQNNIKLGSALKLNLPAAKKANP